MGLLDDLKKGLDLSLGVATGQGKPVSQTALGGLFGGGGGQPTPPPQEEEDTTAAAFDAFLLQQSQDVSTLFAQAFSTNNPEALQAAEDAQALLSSQVNRRPEILASFAANASLQQILEGEDDSEVSMAALQAFANSEETRLSTLAGTEGETLTPEEEDFQTLLNRNTELDVLLKEQQLADAQRQQEFAGIFNLLDALPSKQRADVVAGLLETDLGQRLFFGGADSFAGEPGQTGDQVGGVAAAADVLNQGFFKGLGQ